jgi:hypothetical protein
VWPVKLLGFGKEYGTHFFSAKGDDVVQLLNELLRQVVYGLGILPGNVESELLHDSHGKGIELSRVGACALDSGPGKEVAGKAFGQLAAGGVGYAHEEDVHWRIRDTLGNKQLELEIACGLGRQDSAPRGSCFTRAPPEPGCGLWGLHQNEGHERPR